MPPEAQVPRPEIYKKAPTVIQCGKSPVFRRWERPSHIAVHPVNPFVKTLLPLNGQAAIRCWAGTFFRIYNTWLMCYFLRIPFVFLHMPVLGIKRSRIYNLSWGNRVPNNIRKSIKIRIETLCFLVMPVDAPSSIIRIEILSTAIYPGVDRYTNSNRSVH